MKIPPRIRLAVPALVCLMMMGVAPAASPDMEWTVLSASGQVEFARGQAAGLAWETLARGASLPVAATVRTGPDGRATLASGRSLILVDPDSTLEVPGRASTLRPLRVYQERGSATYDIRKEHRRHFQVVTPYLVAGVKGTVFRVQVSEMATEVLVSEGVVEVFTLRDDLGTEVHAGQQVRLDALPGATPRLAPAPREERERLQVVSRTGRRQHQEARRDGTLPQPESAWIVREGFLQKDDLSTDKTMTEGRLSESGNDLRAKEKEDSMADADADLARELDEEYRVLEEERNKELMDPAGQDPAKQDPVNQPQATGTGV